MSTRCTEFWSGGRDALAKVLREEEEEKLAPLKRALASGDDPERGRMLKEQIKRIKAEFKNKRKVAGSSLFSKA